MEIINSEIRRLTEADEKIQSIAKEYGLDFFPQEFDIVSAQKMLEIMSYYFPINFSHWSFGRDFEIQRTRYEHGFGIPLEVVLNSNPSRAYLMKTNPFPVQVMVMAHVYGHNDFMKNNRNFGPTRRDIIPSASEAATRFQAYERRWGLEEVEKTIDAAMSIELNINLDFFIKEETDEEVRERLRPELVIRKANTAFDDLMPQPKKEIPTELELIQRTPPESTRDVLGYIMNNSPKPLREWQRDILYVIRDQWRYLMPNARTKIMNEGWASYWHAKIMERLFREGYLTAEEHGLYNRSNAYVLAEHPKIMNPYLAGLKMFQDIEDRWNRGRFGKEWEECVNAGQKEKWDLNLGLGRQKIFEVRRAYSDRFFVEEFLTEKLVEDLNLYIYQEHRRDNEIHDVVIEKDWREIKKLLVASLNNVPGVPIIYVTNGDFCRKRELLLSHSFEEHLDEEYRQKTMEHIFFLWDRPVYLETKKDDKNVRYFFDGRSHGME